MKRRVRITKVPKKADGGQNGSSDGLKRFMYGKKVKGDGINTFSEKPFAVNRSISAVPREQSNLEAEGGEFAVVPGQGGIPEGFNITGPRHGGGGVPLDLDEGSFIYSDNKRGMKIKDKEVLEEFGIKTNKKKKKHKGITPAAIAKKYQLNDFKKSLLDPKADKIEKETAELMIKNYNDKLAKLALVQESMKGFPNGIPEVATPFMEMNGIDPNMFSEEQQQENPSMAAYGTGVVNNGIATYTMNNGGSTPKKRVRVYQRGGEFKGAFWDSILQNGSEVPAIQPVVQPINQTPVAPIPPPTPQRGTQYLLNKQGKIMNRREIAMLQNLEKQGESGTNIYDMQHSKPFISGKSYGLGDDRFSFDADNYSGGMNYSKGDYNVVTVPAGDDDPYLEDFNKIKFANPNDYNKLSDRFGKKFDKITFKDGGENKRTSKDMPKKYKDNSKYKEGSPEFDVRNLEDGDWVTRKDGSISIFRGQTNNASYEGDDFDQVFAGDSDYSGPYANIVATFNNPDLKKKLANKMRESLLNKKHFLGKTGKYAKGYTKEEVKEMSDDYLLDQMLNFQKRNYSLIANGIDGSMFKDSDGSLGTKEQFIARWEQDKRDMDPNNSSSSKSNFTRKEVGEMYDNYEKKGYTSLNKAFEKTGVPITEDMISNRDLPVQQASYWAYNDLLKDRDSGKLSPEESERLKGFIAAPRGASDEGQTGDKRISANDGVYTNTTSKELISGNHKSINYDPVEMYKEPKEEPEFVSPEYLPPDEASAPWLQDQLNMGNLLSQRLMAKKYLPNSYPINLETPNPVYFDPSRALAANAEQAGIAAQAARTFAGPQGTNRLSGIMSEGVKNSANIVADYQAKNVGIANQFATSNAGIRNQEELANKQAALNLYNGNVIANQQYDNTIRQMDRNLTDGANQLITNMQETQAWNTLNPYYKTRPTIGGGLWKTNTPRPAIDNGRVPGGEYQARMDKAANLQRINPQWSLDQVLKIMGDNAAAAYPTTRNEQESQYARQAYRPK